MDKYMGFKLVEAEPMTWRHFNIAKGDTVPEVSPGIRGYRIVYPDGYESWSPKEVFENAYLKLSPNPALKSGVSISQQMVDDFIKEIQVFTLGIKTTVVKATLVNGFEIVESSSCVDSANYSQEIGKDICMSNIKDAVWSYLGFLLQTAVSSVTTPKVSDVDDSVESPEVPDRRLTVGKIVHYVNRHGNHRAAIVVNDWGSHVVANLQVFLDGSNDILTEFLGGQLGCGLAWVTAVRNDEVDKKPGTWHWPEE